MDKQKRTTIDEFSAYLQSAVRNTTINYMNDKSKIKEHEITLEEDLENVVLMATLDGNTKTLLPVSELPCILSLIQ